ncbi:hypothetical protein, partial [uncultured Campylobacter sp.]|uniref:hypothetical protein n=1 Tax=uncultured Campylobacter sp. TaxID=218934 RepID=UPI002621FD05
SRPVTTTAAGCAPISKSTLISTSTAADFGLKFKGLGADRVAEFYGVKFKTKFHAAEFRDLNLTERNHKAQNSTI